MNVEKVALSREERVDSLHDYAKNMGATALSVLAISILFRGNKGKIFQLGHFITLLLFSKISVLAIDLLRVKKNVQNNKEPVLTNTLLLKYVPQVLTFLEN